MNCKNQTQENCLAPNCKYANGWSGLVLIRENESSKKGEIDDDDLSQHASNHIQALNAI